MAGRHADDSVLSIFDSLGPSSSATIVTHYYNLLYINLVSLSSPYPPTASYTETTIYTLHNSSYKLIRRTPLLVFSSGELKMARESTSRGIRKLGSWQRCSRLVREQRTRFYIIWRCTVILLRWDE